MKHSSARKTLTARLDQLLPQIGKIEAHLASPLEKDSQERSLQLENDEVLLSTRRGARSSFKFAAPSSGWTRGRTVLAIGVERSSPPGD